MAKQYTIVTEEYLSSTIIKTILNQLDITVISIQKKNITPFGYSIHTELHDNLKIWVVFGDAKQSRGQPMIDVITYKGNVVDDVFNDIALVPVLAIEITKNGNADSGNMCYQRMEKIVWAQAFWKHNKNIKYVMLYNIELDHTCNSTPYNISNRILKTISCSVIENRNGTITEIDCQPYTTLPEFVKHVNSTRRSSGINNRLVHIITDTHSSITIQSNLLHSKNKPTTTPIHDPNTGFVSGIVKVIHTLDPVCDIIISSMCGLTPKLLRNEAKLWSCLKPYKDNIELRDNSDSLYTKNWTVIRTSTCDTDCYAKQTKGEKVSSLYVHHDLESKGWKTIFHNHGGCERSWLYWGNSCHRVDKTNLPDLVMFHPTTKEILVIEAKKNDTTLITGALTQVSTSVEWTKCEIRKHVSEEQSTFKYLPYICVYGDNSHNIDSCTSDIPMLLSILDNGDMVWDPIFKIKYNL